MVLVRGFGEDEVAMESYTGWILVKVGTGDKVWFVPVDYVKVNF